MNTHMMDRPCRHCGSTMRWSAGDQRWSCTSQNCHHKEFEAKVENTTTETTCWCPKCDVEREVKGRPPY
jgi:hypothetical protein